MVATTGPLGPLGPLVFRYIVKKKTRNFLKNQPVEVT
jgi:hypothetical protein